MSKRVNYIYPHLCNISPFENTIMRSFRYFLIIWLLFVNVSVVNAQESRNDSISQISSTLKIGDWIFRQGTAIDSLLVKQLGGGEFSHIGMIISVAPEVKIIHATTDDFENRPSQVLISTLDEFISPDLAQTYAIARPIFLTDEQKQQVADMLQTKLGEKFVLASREAPHLYCTTLLYDAIIQVMPDFNVEWQHSDFALFYGNYLYPNAFAKYKDLIWIYKYPN